MQKTRILIVDSVEDDITRRRHQILESSPRLAEYDIDYCYSAEITEEQEEMLRFRMKPELSVTGEEIRRRIEGKITAFRPHFVLLHTGFVFRDYADEFFRAFSAMKAAHPNTQFGLEERDGLEVDQSAFHNTEEVVSLQNLIFRDILG